MNVYDEVFKYEFYIIYNKIGVVIRICYINRRFREIHNLIVLGESTQLETIVYTTERMEVINADNNSIAMYI